MQLKVQFLSTLATFQTPTSHMRLVATILDSSGRERGIRQLPLVVLFLHT